MMFTISGNQLTLENGVQVTFDLPIKCRLRFQG